MQKKKVRFDPVAVAQRVARTRGLALHMATRYARRYPRIELEDLAQDCLRSITRAAQLYRDRADSPPFSAFALLCLKQCCWAHVRRVMRRANDVSLGEVIDTDGEGEPLTVFDLCDFRRAAAAEAARPARAHEAARYAELRRLIETLETLTVLERRILRLRYVAGLELPEVCRRVRRGQCTVSTASASAIRKMQRHYGIATKAERARAFGPAHHKRYHRRAPHPECSFCKVVRS